MDGFSVSHINTIIFDDSITDYASWKKKRQLLTSQLGQYLLDYNETQLSLIISNWESELTKVSQLKTVEGNMSSLLAFSVLHFFFRSFDHVKKNFPMVNSLCSSENKEVCRTATTTLRYLAEENPDNYTFLRISLESVSSFLKSKGNHSLYNGLLILRQCGRFIPSDVFGITINTMPEIWSAICSPDKSLQKVAVKVINIHLLRVPSNTAESYAQSLAFDCYSMLNAKKSTNYTGFILTLRTIYHLFPKSIEIPSLVSKLINSLSIKTTEIPIETYRFLLLLSSKRNLTILSKEQTLAVFSSLLSFLSSSSTYQSNSYVDLLDFLDSFIQVLPKNVVQVDEIVEKLSSSLATIQNKKILNHFFKVFCTIIKLFPQQKIPASIFTNGIPCKNALNALRMRIGILMEIREPMMKTFHEGLNPKADYYQQKVSLRIFATFQNILFERVDEMFPLLRPFGYSQNEKIRRLFASILHAFSCQEATDEMIRLAMIDESKKVRLCALEQIKAEAFVDKVSPLFQLLTDTSYEVRRAAIPLIAAAAKLNPLYIVPQIVLFVNSFLVTNVSHANPARSAKACSLMPLIAEHFVQFETQFIPNLTWFCVWFLSHGNPIQEIPSAKANIASRSSQCDSLHMMMSNSSQIMPMAKMVDFPPTTNQLSMSVSISDDDPIHPVDLRQVVHRDFLFSTLGGKSWQKAKPTQTSTIDPNGLQIQKTAPYNSFGNSISSFPGASINNLNPTIMNEINFFCEDDEQQQQQQQQQQQKASNNSGESSGRLLSMVYRVENSKWIAKCDSFLFKTLQNLSRYLRPYMYQVIPVFVYTFSYQQKDIVYLAALNALRQIIIEENAEINIFSVFPYLLPALLKLIAICNSKEIIITVLKLTGTMGASSTVSTEKDSENSYVQLISIQNMSFFTHYVLRLLCQHFKEPSASVCAAYAMIFSKDPDNAVSFLDEVINSFISVINRESEVDVLFNELEMIILHTKMNIVPYLDQLLPMLSSHITNINCIRCCISLSYHLKTEFIDCATVLYPSTLHVLSKNNDNLLYKTILKFISYVIIFQNQNPELFIEQAEIQLLGPDPLDDVKTSSILKSITKLVQLRKLTMYSSRISRICFSLLYKNSLNEVIQLVLSLCQFEDFSIDIVELFLNNTGLKIPLLSNIRAVIQAPKKEEQPINEHKFSATSNPISLNSIDNEPTMVRTDSSLLEKKNSVSRKRSKQSSRSSQNSFKNSFTEEDDDLSELNSLVSNADAEESNSIQNVPGLISSKEVTKAPVLSTSHLDYLNAENPTESAFSGLKQPVFNNSRVWIDELCTRVVKNSPSVAIRSCAQTIAQSQSFRDDLFPFAFLSCWLATFRIQDRSQFSKTILMILANFETIDPVIIDLAELADRVGFPLTVPDNVLAKASQNPCLSLYFLQRYLRDNPDSKETIQQLLELNSRMGFLDSARGILTSYSSQLSELDKAKWYEQLGEWEKALEIFENQYQHNPTINITTSLIHCYAQLEMWDRIRNMEDLFEGMTLEEKKQNALWFSCAEYHYSNKQRALEFLSSDYANDDIETTLYRTIFAISSGHYENASSYIQKGFELLAENNTVFDGSDASQATRRMVYAQHFIELNEALWMKRENINSIPKIWQNRIKNFSHESDAWIRMIEIRGLVLSPQDHIESYLKMVSVLRKERKWRLIDSYCERSLKNIYSPSVLVSRLKNLWARGEKSESLIIIKFINKIINVQNQEQLQKICQKYRPILPFENIQSTDTESDNIENDTEFLNSVYTNDTHTGVYTLEKNDNIMYFHNELMKLDELTYDKIVAFRNDNKVDKKFIARMLRIQGNWEYKMYNSTKRRGTPPLQALIKISKVLEKSKDLEPNDSRTWAGWAYANSRALSHADNEKRPQFAINAISGFLKATQLQPSESLEYLCQMFSIIFRYGVETVFDTQLHGEIVSLPPSIIIQIIPQIVVHIAHHDVNIRQLVQDIIYVFGSDHFEAVIYPLNVLSMIEDNEISTTAKSFIDVLGRTREHMATYSDARLFIRGMHKAAVSWLENWITTLETASKAQQRGNRETVIRVISKQFESSELPTSIAQKSSPQYNGPFSFKDYQQHTERVEKIQLIGPNEDENGKYKDEETQCNNICNFIFPNYSSDDMNYEESFDSSFVNKRKYMGKNEFNHDKESELCEFDRMLSRQYSSPLLRCRSAFEKYKNGNDTMAKTMWDNFRALFNEFENHLKKIDTIQLSKISAELANKRGFNLAIPGTYEVNKSAAPSTVQFTENSIQTQRESMMDMITTSKSPEPRVNSDFIPQLYYIEPELQVLGTQAHPRAVHMVDTTGNRSKFLLKGNEDLRLDQRIMQFFKLINSLLSTNRNTNELGTSISQYAVVPFAPNAGLISWVTGSDTLQVLVSEYRSHRHIRKNIEMDIYTQFCGNIYNHLMSVQRHEVFNEVTSKTSAGEIREMLWLRSPSPTQWVLRNKNYTISTALMSMAGYTIGLGDRHPNNIMIQKHTGRVIHIDFGDSFEVAINRKTYKERVPFRLTRMILNALDGDRVDGLFRTCCENVLWVLRENQSSIIAQLEVFVHEPIFYGREISTSETATSMILERVSMKLNGKDPVQFDAPENITLNVEQQVSTLIKIAADPTEYDRHFLGWCPFW